MRYGGGEVKSDSLILIPISVVANDFFLSPFSSYILHKVWFRIVGMAFIAKHFNLDVVIQALQLTNS